MLHFFRALLLLAAFAAVQAGCASSNADLGYTPNNESAKPGDGSYHGWNNANQ